MTSKVMWKSGELSLSSLKEEFGLGKKGKGGAYKSSEGALFEVRRHLYDLMRDIETLAEIDFPKMLSLKVSLPSCRSSSSRSSSNPQNLRRKRRLSPCWPNCATITRYS
jgi:hypothetical protein